MWIAEVLAKHTAALLMLLSFPSSVLYEISLEEPSAYSGGQIAGFISEITNALTLDEESSAIFQIRFKNNSETEVSYWIHLLNSS